MIIPVNKDSLTIEIWTNLDIKMTVVINCLYIGNQEQETHERQIVSKYRIVYIYSTYTFFLKSWKVNVHAQVHIQIELVIKWIPINISIYVISIIMNIYQIYSNFFLYTRKELFKRLISNNRYNK